MHVIHARNVNGAFAQAMALLNDQGIKESSRNGPVLVAPYPVCTVYRHPLERVLFVPERDANPYFHLMEALWMLAGRNAVGELTPYNKRMAEFSDDGEVLHGAYGFRWREWWGFDQLTWLIDLLRTKPDTRRAVLTMWSPLGDCVAAEGGAYSERDQPCNTHAYFDRRGGALNMLVSCRSNDAVWGAYGANVVHFSFLQEYVAAALRVPVGTYRQVSNNLHVYLELPGVETLLRQQPMQEEPYAANRVMPFPLLSVSETLTELEHDLQMLFRSPFGEDVAWGWATQFFREVVVPMRASWLRRRDAEGRRLADGIGAADWRLACLQWLKRREEARHG